MLSAKCYCRKNETTTFPMTGIGSELSANITDLWAGAVIYEMSLPSRLDSLHCGVNPCGFSSFLRQFYL
jgi:hypothetical protein